MRILYQSQFSYQFSTSENSNHGNAYKLPRSVVCVVHQSASAMGLTENMERSKNASLNIPHNVRRIYHYQTDNEVGYYPPSRYLYDNQPDVRCMRCPKDKMVVAKRGADSVLMERPMFGFCKKNKRSKKVVAHILVGPKVGDVITAGTYTIIMNLIHKVKPYHVRTCKYNYTVIVTTCTALQIRKHVKKKCTNDRKWGSICSFECPHGYKLVGPRRTKCMSSGRWRKHTPYCKRKYWEADCRIPDLYSLSSYSLLNCDAVVCLKTAMVSEGTVCRFECDEGFEIPKEIQHLSIIKCDRGQWNTTQDPSCIPTSNSSLATTETADVV